MILAVICFLLVAQVEGSVIHFNSTSTSLKPSTKDLTLTCLLKDTPAISQNEIEIVGRSIPDTTHDDRQEDFTYTEDIHNTAEGLTRRALTNTSENIDFVTAIAISRDGVDVAVMSVHVPAKAIVASPNMQVTGNLSEGILQVTWANATDLLPGNYTCDIDTINSVAHSFDFSKSLLIVEEEVSLKDLVKTVNGLMNHVDNLKLVEEVMLSTIDALKKENELQRQEIDDLKNKTCECPMKDNTTVLFSAALSNSSTYIGNEVVIFNRVFTNEGGAYNSSTGVFTCPVDGFYEFVVNAGSEFDQQFGLYLRHDDKNDISIATESGHGFQMSSNSAILQCAKGETVFILTYFPESHLYAEDPQLRTTFSGHLIAVV